MKRSRTDRPRVTAWAAGLVLCAAFVTACDSQEREYRRAMEDMKEATEQIAEKAAAIERLEEQRRQLDTRIEQAREALEREQEALRSARQGASAAATDAILLEAIRRALAKDPRTEDAPIGIRVEAGVAHLSGTVDSPEQKAHALALAAIPGVASVKSDQLKVAQVPPPSP